MDSDIELARIKPFKYDDKLTGHKIAIQVREADWWCDNLTGVALCVTLQLLHTTTV